GKLEKVDHEIHHTDDGRGKLKIEGGKEKLKDSEVGQQSENKAGEGSSKEENLRKENAENAGSEGEKITELKENIEDTDIGSQDCLVHNSAKIDVKEMGTLIYPVEIFDDSERKELSGVLNDSLLVNFISSGKIGRDSLNNYRSISLLNGSTSNNTQPTDKGKSTLIIFGVVFVLLFAGLAIIKSRFNKNKKSKKQATEKEKPVIIQLDENQYKHFLIAFGNIVRELNSIAFKVKELENGMKLIEEIDNDVTRYRHSGYYFSSNNEVRSSCHHGCGHSHREYDDLRDKYNALERERNDLRTDRDN
ncbi:13912_t:CDS:2, partial [Ambispora leptoticha]